MEPTASRQDVGKEFDRWAEAGRGEHMEEDHLPIVLPMLDMIRFASDDSVLDVGCGTGWLARRISALVPQGRMAGMDVSSEMVRRARQFSSGVPNVSFFSASVAQIPSAGGAFAKVVSVESAYYWPDPTAGLKEIFRVLQPGGSAWILINYYGDNAHCHQWGPILGIPTQLLWAKEWVSLFRDAGFTEIVQRRIADESTSPAVYTGRWFRDAEQLRAFKRQGALLVSGIKRAGAR